MKIYFQSLCPSRFSAAFLFIVLSNVLPAANPPTQATEANRAWSLLEDGLAEKSGAKRAQATHALGLLSGNRRAQTAVEKLLSDPDKDVRAEACGSLGRMNAQTARPKLRAALNDKEVKVVIASANALYQLKDPAAYQVFYALLTGDQKPTAGLVHSQLDMLHDPKQVERIAIEAGMSFVPYGGVGVEAWKTITHDDASPIRAAAALALANDPDPRSAKGLADTADDKKWLVRAAVVEAIARRGDPALLSAVVPLLEDSRTEVRYDAAASVIYLSAIHKHPAVRKAPVKPVATP